MTRGLAATALNLSPDQFLTADGLVARRVSAGASWFRIHRSALAPVYFGGPDAGMRFNDPGEGANHVLAPAVARGSAPDSGAYGVCYFGVSPEASFVEIFFRRLPSVSVDASELLKRSVIEVVLARDLLVARLNGPCLLRLGVSADIVAGRDYAPAQVVARGLWRHPARFDGIEYPTRHDPGERSIALFNRASAAVPASAILLSEVLDPDLPLVKGWIERYDFELFEDR